MTLNSVIALILCYFIEFDSFGGDYVTVVEDRLIMSARAFYWVNLELHKTVGGERGAAGAEIELRGREN